MQLSSIPQHPLLIKVAEECVEVSRKIQLILEKCKLDPQSPKAVAIVKAWARSQTVKSELQRLQLELESSSGQLRTAIAAATRADLASMKQSLSNMGNNQSEILEKLTSISEEISSRNGAFLDASRLIAVVEETQDFIKYAAIMRALKPKSAHSRESEIHGHHGKTFEWIIDPKYESRGYSNFNDIGFVDWLKHGSGVFHFAGKPGAGKSTLFKFLANDGRVRQALEEWATSVGKQLVISKFFFWRHGPANQSSVAGLLRGLLFEICTDKPCLAKLLFPGLWGQGGLRKGVSVKDDDIRASFDQMCTNEEIRRYFRVCLFIDGLDEVNSEEVSHWKLAMMLKEWTHLPDSFLKLCVSSREDHPIMTVFQTSRQIRLQDVTQRDIWAIVNDRLLGNEYFQRLEKRDTSGCQELIRSILQGAEGVFLWVSLLLNLLEDELPGASSVAALQCVVRTTPPQLDDFIGKILDTIPKYRHFGAYFILAMALRMTGLHLNDHGSFPDAEQSEYEVIFGTELYWRPYLPTFGLSAVLEILEKGNKPGEYGAVPAPTTDEGYKTRSQDAVMRIRKWCKGLLDVFEVDEWDLTNSFDHMWDTNPRGLDLSSEFDSDGGHEFTFIKFSHKSIPDFLRSVIRDKVRELGFDDVDVAKGILAMLIAETASSHNDRQPLAHNLGYCMQHVLRLLRLRVILGSNAILPMLEQLEVVRFQAYRRAHQFSHGRFSYGRFYHGRSCHQDPARCLNVPCGSQQEFELFWDNSGFESAVHEVFLPWNESATVLTHASHAGLHEYIRWKLENNFGLERSPALLFSALGGLSAYYSFFWGDFPRCYTTTLRLLFEAGAPLDLPTPFALVEGKAYRLRICHATEAFSQDKPLQTELDGGAADHFAGWAWLTVLPSILKTLIFSEVECALHLWEFLEVWLEFGAMPPVDIIHTCFDFLGEKGSSPVTKIRYRVPVDSKYRNRVYFIESGFTYEGGTGRGIQSRCGTSEAVNLADLIRSHRPPNGAIMLGYIERNLAVVHHKIIEQSGIVEIKRQ